MRVVLALGSNLGDRFATLQGALDALFDGPELTFVTVSPVYETDPFGGPDQGPYLNAVAIAETTLEPWSLLERVQDVENAFGRVRKERWGARTLDLDLITVENVVMNDPDLTLPHPRADERAFVLVPWVRADPEAVLSGRGVADLLEELDQDYVRPRPDLTLKGPA
ncbi:2-amino-4-hydroxy-6-hydroxymethyldihydropteridine diphosphokinase [Streptosporangium lutulentum]|uniref:2-amino-4-hydroxy-6-hydroxymethyldihydropteridine diphosphokinase n=1 Tax=Streptosporangium lutulentum TaxID=1461250 RepID=A0ABT9QN91_9ACTN|nr:2-amino-4-hydroxy-6-hydroxymethyldihydropteridine diphosphokinase [Streptosporangium lutulentum]MDP9848206.1 2-amino-4-hydroxy-6-hydroxymethyldihydropteridine diphosphokinase [Streptosporangium lutulentum]